MWHAWHLRNTTEVCGGKPEGRARLLIHVHKLVDNIKVDVEQVVWI